MGTCLHPQDPKAQILRVNQAGEQGAVRIYQGQLAVLGRAPVGPLIHEMLAQEQAHLAKFNAQMQIWQVRKTVLEPLWSVAGFGLGALSALMGPRGAMACTVAIEEVIADHYRGQEQALGDEDPDLKALIVQCREEEESHRDIGLDNDAEQAPGYRLFSRLIKCGARLAIALSKRI